MRIKKIQKNLLPAWAALLTALATQAHAADEKTFAIKFDRPASVGQKFALVATETVRTRQKIELPDGNANTTDSLKRVTLEADARVDKIDDKARESQITLVVKSFSMQLGEAAQKLLDAGAEITVTFDGPRTLFALKSGDKLPDAADAGLRQIFKSQREQKLLYDSIYGTPAKKTVGDSWPVSPAALATDPQLPGSIDPAQVTGTAVLKAVKPVAGVECAQVEAALVINNVPIEGARAKESTLSVSLSSTQPTDLSKPIASSTVRVTSHAVIEQQPNGRGTIRYIIDSETAHAATWTPKP